MSLRRPHLRRPDARCRASFVDAVEEFRAEGLDDRARSDQDLGRYADWSSADGFAGYVRAITTPANEQAVVEGRVPSTRLWWTSNDEYLGRVDLRHGLTPALTQVGGHIGYAVRPSARGQGHATAMLREALVVARVVGLERVLLTCDVDNSASRRVIVANDGELEDRRGGTLRFWIET